MPGDIASLFERYGRGGWTPVDELKDALRRVQTWDERLHAVVHVDEARAFADANASLHRWREGRALALDGVPVTVKDIVDVAGIPTRMGTEWLRPPHPAVTDATVVERLRRAGAIVFAKTRLLEFAYGIVNPADGPVHNPHDRRRTSGGSSSGAAAGVAVGIGYGAVGTDTGGSIRIPAAYCGVWGLKPTYGRVPTNGVFPLSQSLDHVGPIARSADDLLRVFAVIAEGDAVLPPRHGQVRLGVLLPWGRDPVTAEVRDAFLRAMDRLAHGGTVLTAVAVPDLVGSETDAIRLIQREATAVHRAYAERQAVRYAQGTLAQLQAGEALTARHEQAARERQAELRRAVDCALTGVDALVMPTVGWTAPEKDPVFDEDEGTAECWYTLPFNFTGHPGLSLPLPDLPGLPAGLQLVAPHGQDEALIRLGEWVESRLAGPLR